MKRTLGILMLLILSISMVSCTAVSKKTFDLDSIKSYKDIPGVTEEDIAAIEALKKERTGFSYGHLLGTEAFILPDGTNQGFSAGFCELLSSLFGIDFVQEYYEQWNVLKDDIDNQKIDFTGDFTLTTERMEIYYMTHSIAERSQRIFTSVNAAKIEKESDVNGLVIGFTRGSVVSQTVMRYYPELTFAVVDIDSYSDAAEKLKSGEIDAFVDEGVIDPFFDEYDYIDSKEFFPLVYAPVSMTTANPALEPIISVMNKYILAGGIDKLYEIYRAGDYDYAEYKLNKSFTDEELKYMRGLAAQNTKVRVAYENDNYPVSFYNKTDNEFQGIAVDILSEISKLTGIVFEPAIANNASWTEIMEKLKTGEISMVTELIYSDMRANHYIWSGKPYLTSHYALLSKKDYPSLTPSQVVRTTVGAMKGSVYEDIYKKWFPGNNNLITFATQDTGFEALEKGNIDLLMTTEIMLLTQTNYREKTGYKVNLKFNTTVDSLFGFNKNEVILRSIIDKVQSFINTNAIVSDWTGRVFDYSKKFSDERTFYLMVFVVVLIVILIIMTFLLVKNQRLGKDLERQTATLSTIYTSIPDLVFCKDINGIYTSCNPSFEKFAGYSEDEIVGKSDIQIFKINEKMANLFMDADKKVLNNPNLETIEELVTYPDGRQRLLETLKTPLIQNGKVIGLMGISRDITERKAVEEEARVASKAKSTFLAHMSHEIRTPLNAIVGMAGILKNSISNPEKVLSSANQIISSSHYLLGVLNDVLDMSKIESGKLTLSHEPFGLVNAYKEVSDIIMQRCLDKNINFVTNINEMKDITLIGDKLRVNQVLINLLGNAVKFTDVAGEIALTVEVLEEDINNIRLKYTISDNGIGMSEEQIARLFVPFEQADSSIAARFGGTGLGLSISRNLVNMMGGEIVVESESSVGSKFCFELSFEKGNAVIEDSPEVTGSIDLTGKRILLVEDIEINRVIISEILSPTGAEIDEAENGRQALDIFTGAPIDYYNLIFMDVQMPVMDGFEATRQIRALERRDAKTIPIVAMTANAYKEDIDQALAAGMNRHLAKPIDVDVLMDTLNEFIKIGKA